MHQAIYLPCTDWKVFEKSTDLWATKGLDLPRQMRFGTRRFLVKSISIEIYETDFSQRGSLQWPTIKNIKTSLLQKNNNK